MNDLEHPPTRPSNTRSAPAAAHGASTIMEILDEATQLGFGTQQTARDGAQIECASCGEKTDAGAFDVEHIRRLEGASDAADMLLITYARCPRCHVGGALTLTYGPNAGEIDASVLDALDLSNADAAPMPTGEQTPEPHDGR